MAYDLTATTDGTLRTLGNKQYIYNAAKTRWDRVLPKLLAADITVDYDGKETGNSYIANQYVTGTVIWNQPVTSFGTSNISFTFGSGTIFNNTVTQDLFDPKKYTFLFQYSGAVGQFAIPANSVTSSQDNTVNPLTIYSPAIPGVYKPYPVITIVSKTANNVPVYSIDDPFTPGVTRYFSKNLGSATTASVRLRVAFQNFVSVATSSYTTGDIDRTRIFGTPNFSVLNIHTTADGTTTAIATTPTRFTDLYYTSSGSISTPVLTYISIAASAYIDNGISNDASPRIYFSNLPSNSVGMTASTYNVNFASSNAQVGGIQIAFDHYVALLQSMPSLSSITRVSGTGTGSLSNLRRLTAQNFPGNTLYADYTLAATPEDYTETFRVPASWATFDGTTNVTKDPTGATAAFTTRTNSSSADVTITVVRSAVTVTTNPTNGATAVSSNSIVLTFNRTMTRVVGKNYRIRTGDSNGTIVVNTVVPTPSGSTVTVSYPEMFASTDYYIEFDVGSYVDVYGNTSPTVAFSFQTAATPSFDIVFSTFGTTSWVVPPFVRSISAVGVGSGNTGNSGPFGGYTGPCCCVPIYKWGGGAGGKGGGLSYRNSIAVTPGETLTVTNTGNVSIKRGSTFLLSALAGSAGGNGGGTIDGVVHDGGGNGGVINNGVDSLSTINRGGGGGGGAGGYSGTGGVGGGGSTAPADGIAGTGGAGGGGSSAAGGWRGGNGGGVGLYGAGSDGSGGTVPTTPPGQNGGDGGNGSNGTYGGGGGGGYSVGSNPEGGRAGGLSAVRILWGDGRAFPSTNVSSQSS
jgi:hypothetical protein